MYEDQRNSLRGCLYMPFQLVLIRYNNQIISVHYNYYQGSKRHILKMALPPNHAQGMKRKEGLQFVASSLPFPAPLPECP